MRIIVAGGRDFEDYISVERELDKHLRMQESEAVEIVSGDCRGADMLGVRYAKERNISVSHFPADWDKYGKAAGPIRNKQMAEYAAEDNGCLFAFWDGKSRGTKNMIHEAEKVGLSVKVVYY